MFFSFHIHLLQLFLFIPSPPSELHNPFDISFVNLPRVLPSCGTDRVNNIYLTRKYVVPTVERVFKEENILLKQNVTYQNDGIQCILDGYNAQHKIGYIWLDTDNLARDTWMEEWEYSASKRRNDYDFKLKKIQNIIGLVKSVRGGHYAFSKMQTLLDSALVLQDMCAQEQMFDALLETGKIVDSYRIYRPHFKAIREQLPQALSEFYFQGKRELYDEMIQWYDQHTVSMEDLRLLVKKMEQKELFIAFISASDAAYRIGRYRYGYYSYAQAHQDSLKKIENKQLRQQYQDQIEREALAIPIADLTDRTEGFIKWRQQQ